MHPKHLIQTFRYNPQMNIMKSRMLTSKQRRREETPSTKNHSAIHSRIIPSILSLPLMSILVIRTKVHSRGGTVIHPGRIMIIILRLTSRRMLQIVLINRGRLIMAVAIGTVHRGGHIIIIVQGRGGFAVAVIHLNVEGVRVTKARMGSHWIVDAETGLATAHYHI